MAHFALLWKARAVEKLRLNYEKEKTNSIALVNVDLPKKRISERWRSYRSTVSTNISRTFTKWFPKGSAISSCILYLKTDQTFLTFFFKSMLGFIGGIILTYLCFMFFVFQLSISFMLATFMSSGIGVLLTLGLAFSYRIRCLVFLLIPQLFSRVGRYTLTCYALVLILTGPATNTMKNSEVLSESMACSQEHIKKNVREINDAYKNTYSSVRDGIKLMIKKFKIISKQLTNVVVKVNRLVLSIVSNLQFTFNWLKSVAVDCDNEFGKPYDYCEHLLNKGVRNCKHTLGAGFVEQYCNVNFVTKATCGNLMIYESFCAVSELVDDSILDTVKKKLRTFSDRIAAMLFIDVHIHHSYSFSSNASRSASQVAAGIVTEIRNRADPLLTWLSWSSCVTSLFLLLIIFRAKYYQQMYETRSRFDNRYITQELRDLDLKRLREGRETILPLNRRERARYVTTTSFRLVSSEKVHLNRSAVFMTITTFKLLIHIVADYSLYWVLMTIRHYGKLQSPFEDEFKNIGVYVTGSTIAAKFIRSLINALKIPLSSAEASPISCLPDPFPPDLGRYMQIGVLIFLLWFFAIFEPYGLRLRHVIMGRYRPERAKARAAWLYNHILRTRGGFMKFARKKLHREYKYTSESHLTFKKWISNLKPCKCLYYLCGICVEEKRCLLCETKEYANNIDGELIRCKSKSCQGTYCTRCFSDIGELCTICLSPKDYGDLSDVSLEKGSSEESSDSDNDENTKNKDKSSNKLYLYNAKYYEDRDKNDYRKPKETKHWYPFTGSTQREDKIPLLPHKKHQVAAFMSNHLDYNCTLISLNTLNTNMNFVEIDVITNKLYKTKKHAFNLDLEFVRITNGFFLSYKFFKEIDQNLRLSTKPAVYDFKVLDKRLNFHNTGKVINSPSIISVRQNKHQRRSLLIDYYESKYLSNKLRTAQFFQKMYLVSNTILSDSNNITDRYFLQQEGNDKAQIDNVFFNYDNNKNESSRRDINQKEGKNKKQNNRNEEKEDTSSCFGKCSSLCYKYWTNLKESLFKCTAIADDLEESSHPLDKVKNFKRRKKRSMLLGMRKSDSLTRTKEDIDEARKLRIFTYFSDQEWIKTNSDTKYYKIKIDSNMDLGEPIEPVQSKATTTHNERNNELQSAMKSNIRHYSFFRANHDSYFQGSSLPSHDPLSERQKYFDRINNVGKNLTKRLNCCIRKTFGLKAQKICSSVELDNNIGSEVQKAQIEEEIVPAHPQPSVSYSKRFNFYRSLGVNEFDEIVGTVKENESANLKSPKEIQCTSKSDKERRQIDAAKETAEINNKRSVECATSVAVFLSESKRHKVSVKGNVINKKWMHITLKNPLYALREFYSSITGFSLSDKLNKNKKKRRNSASKEVAVMPVTKSFSCQNVAKEEALTTQTEADHKIEAAFKSSQKKCNHATQRIVLHRDVGTWVNHRRERRSKDGVPRKRRPSKRKHSGSESLSNDTGEINELALVIPLANDEINVTGSNLSNIDIDREARRRRERKRKREANTTGKSTVCDVCTETDDWWSPLMETRKFQNSPMIEKKEGVIMPEINEEEFMQKVILRRRMTNKGIMTDPKTVTFKSHAQIIPAEVPDILSSSRSLIEKQRVDFKDKPINCRHHHTRRVHRAKRLEENYSSRKAVSSSKRSHEAPKVANPEDIDDIEEDVTEVLLKP